MKTENVVLRRRIIAKGVEKDFGLGPGVLVQDEITYKFDPVRDSDVMLAARILRDKEQFLNDHIEVKAEQLEPALEKSHDRFDR